MKKYSSIVALFIILLILLMNIVFASETRNDSVERQIYSFEKAYECFKNNGIFFKDQKTAFNGTIWALCQFFKDVSLPLLKNDNEEKNLEAVKDYLRQILVSKPTDLEKIDELIIGGLTSTDPYGRLITNKDFHKNLVEKIGNYEGDGVGVVFQDNKALVFYVIPDSPAERAGIQVGDEVVRVNNISLENLISEKDLDDRTNDFSVNEYKEGKELIYEILRDKKKMIFKTRIIKITEKNKIVEWQIIDNIIGVVRLKKFDSGCSDQFIAALDQINAIGARGLIVDLTNNSGGYMWEAMVIIKALTGKGFKDELSGGREVICQVDDSFVKGPLFKGPIVILINKNSASAAETTAACLQEYGAVLFGTPTYGKNFGQRTYLLPDKNYFVISNHWIKTLNNRSWPAGVQPDILAKADKYPANEAERKKEAEMVLEKAKIFLLEKIKNQPVSFCADYIDKHSASRMNLSLWMILSEED